MRNGDHTFCDGLRATAKERLLFIALETFVKTWVSEKLSVVPCNLFKVRRLDHTISLKDNRDIEDIQKNNLWLISLRTTALLIKYKNLRISSY